MGRAYHIGRHVMCFHLAGVPHYLAVVQSLVDIHEHQEYYSHHCCTRNIAWYKYSVRLFLDDDGFYARYDCFRFL